LDFSALAPKDYGLTHDQWRPHQFETLEWAEQLATTGVLEAPTGSGKTALPKALSHNSKVISLVQHKQLQQRNYGEKYEFDVLYGKSNYPCVHPDNPDVSADACLYDGKMTQCDYYDECPYVIAREMAKNSFKASLNYSYWFTARWLRKHEFDYLVCDEGHNLSDQVLDFTGCTVDEFKRAKYGLPEFPNTHSVEEVVAWMVKAQSQLKAVSRQYQGFPKEIERIKRLNAKLEDTQNAIALNSKDWFVRSGVIRQQNPQLVAKPLTARYHFPSYFLSPRYKVILMSATIGDTETFTKELGMIAGSWESRRVPSVWEAKVRPVLIPDDCPKMNYKSTPQEKTHQALVIAREIKKYPADWCGVVHVSSKMMAKDLARMLSRFGLENRVWVPTEGISTEQVMKDWIVRKKKVAGSIAVAWAWWEGVDLTEERICIVAKVPFPSLGDEYESERMHYDGSFYLQRTAWDVEQGLGRSRRGEAEDYDINGERTQLVMIADGNWNRVKKYLSANLKESVVMI
jgi:ATP-dependent DNA helicase DinG